MGYKVKVRFQGLHREYGTGREGEGPAYINKAAAEKRAEALKRYYARLIKEGARVTIIRG